MTEQWLQDRHVRQLLDAAPDAVVIVEQSGDIVLVNREVQHLFGWTEGELLGRPIGLLIPQRFQRVLEAEPVRGEEPQPPSTKGSAVCLLARRRDGSEFPVEITRRPLGPADDAPIVATIRDLTEWRRAQEMLFREKEQASVTLASIADAVVTTDGAGTITYLNPTAERLHGLAHDRSARPTVECRLPPHIRYITRADRERHSESSPRGARGRSGRRRAAVAARWDGGCDRRLGRPAARPQWCNNWGGAGLS